MSDIILYGRGKTGQGLLQMTQKLGLSSVFYDDEKGFDSDGCFAKDCTVITSPGVKPTALGLKEAERVGAKTVCELEFCFPYLKGSCVSVTGTNGKTTTCQLIYHILKDAKRHVYLLGNGGVPLSCEVLNVKSDETVVLESSSFQLHGAQSFSPLVSVFTNIAPDHLDYHESFASYMNAKRNNFLHQKDSAYSVFNADDPMLLSLSEESPAYTLYYSVSNSYANCYFVDNAVHLNVGGRMVIFSCPDLTNLAKHNLSNALCAILVCFLLGVDVEFSCKSVLSYSFLPHRLQTVGYANGVSFVDDSKATNVHATLSALSCYQNSPLALILGGSDKGLPFDEIFQNLKSNVRFVCAVGQTAEKIQATGRRYLWDVEVFSGYRSAVYACYKRLKGEGGVVLMSNACASFDMFGSYSERGEHFTKIVGELCRDEKI